MKLSNPHLRVSWLHINLLKTRVFFYEYFYRMTYDSSFQILLWKRLRLVIFFKQMQNCRTWSYQIAKTVCDRMVRTDGNRSEIKSECPLTEGNEGHKWLKKGDEIKWKLDRQQKNISNSNSNSHKWGTRKKI